MVSIAQVLIKLGHSFDEWTGAERSPLYYADFEAIMRSPGIPSYSATKTIREKWKALAVYPIHDTKYNMVKPDVYMIDFAKVRQYIEETIPECIRYDVASRSIYLKSGRIIR